MNENSDVTTNQALRPMPLFEFLEIVFGINLKYYFESFLVL